MTTIKRIPRETRIAYETCRAMAVERASRLAESLGVDTLPLDVASVLALASLAAEHRLTRSEVVRRLLLWRPLDELDVSE